MLLLPNKLFLCHMFSNCASINWTVILLLVTLTHLFYTVFLVNENGIKDDLVALFFNRHHHHHQDPHFVAFCQNRLAKHVRKVSSMIPEFDLDSKPVTLIVGDNNNDKRANNWMKLDEDYSDDAEKGCLTCAVVGAQMLPTEDLGYMLDRLDVVMRITHQGHLPLLMSDTDLHTMDWLGHKSDIVIMQKSHAKLFLDTNAGLNDDNNRRQGGVIAEDGAFDVLFQPCTDSDLTWFHQSKMMKHHRETSSPATAVVVVGIIDLAFLANVRRVVGLAPEQCPSPALVAVMLAVHRCPWVSFAGINHWTHLWFPEIPDRESIKRKMNQAELEMAFLEKLRTRGELVWNMTGFSRVDF